MKKNDIELIKSMLVTKKELDLATKNFEHASRRTYRLLHISNESK